MRVLKIICLLVFICVCFSSCRDILDPLYILHDRESSGTNYSGNQTEQDHYEYINLSKSLKQIDSQDNLLYTLNAYIKFNDYAEFRLIDSVLKYDYNEKEFKPLENKFDFRITNQEKCWKRGNDKGVSINENYYVVFSKAGLYDVTVSLEGVKDTGETDIIKKLNFRVQCVLNEEEQNLDDIEP